ncbi:hypothetical protein MNBD_GAMMA01-855 [hydrothermal vent metagenome]|uniref:Lcl C-terminal domain-containing protein n=1 Tax=hydrothermal vent metagenome TaxID=652676 RepID=A0A3B0W899_9ZZZZ
MKFKTLSIISIVLFSNYNTAQADLVFKNGFEYPMVSLNDTGITWAGEYPSGNNTDCTSTTITSSQDCNTGRDANLLTNSDDDGHAGFSFTKLDATGAPLIDQSADYATTPWACVKDNVTGLVWEVKTSTAGIHHQDNTYQWGGLTAIGRDHPNRQGTYYDPSWNELVQGSIDDSLCGFDNWRVPTVAELSSIANKGTFNPSIDTNYFPNTVSTWFWSSSPIADNAFGTWTVYFYSGYDNYYGRDNYGRVRLVRSGQ